MLCAAILSGCSFSGKAAEGHIILDCEEKNGTIKVYTIAS